MKIFNKEDGKEKVYVQMNDIAMMNSHVHSIPASIFEQVFTDIVIIDDSNRMDFVCFDKKHEIDFFASLDWIVDYKELGYLSLEELTKRAEEIGKRIDEIADKYNNMTDAKKFENRHLVLEYELLSYQYSYHYELINLKKGKRKMPIPLVPDSEGFKFSGSEDSLYEVMPSLDHEHLLIYRKDGKPFTESDSIPYDFLQGALSIAILEQSDSDSFMGDYAINKKMSEDKKYFIIEFKTKAYSKNRKESKKEKTGIKEYFKKLGNKIFK